MSRHNLVVPIEMKDGGTFWHKIGAAFENRGKGYTLAFNSLPIPDKDGNVRVMMFPDENSQERKSGPAAEKYRKEFDAGEIDDKIPY